MVLAFFATIVGFLGLPHLEHTHLPEHHARPRRVARAERGPQLVHAERARADADHAARRGRARRSSLMGIALMIGVARHRSSRTRSTGADRRRPSSGSSMARSPARTTPSKHKLWFDEIYDADHRAAVPRRRARPVRGRRPLHHRYGRGQRRRVRRRPVRPRVALVPERPGPALPRRPRRRCRAGVRRSPTAARSRRSSTASSATTCSSTPSRARASPAPTRSCAGTSTATACPTSTPDAQACSTRADITVRAGEVGSHVTLWIDDPISQKTITVTRAIKLDRAAAPASEVTP